MLTMSIISSIEPFFECDLISFDSNPIDDFQFYCTESCPENIPHKKVEELVTGKKATVCVEDSGSSLGYARSAFYFIYLCFEISS